MTITSEKGETVIYLKEKGAPFRTEALNTQLAPKKRLPTVELKNRSLHDLIPGKIYAITVDTDEDFGVYSSSRELWLALNPSTRDDPLRRKLVSG